MTMKILISGMTCGHYVKVIDDAGYEVDSIE